MLRGAWSIQDGFRGFDFFCRAFSIFPVLWKIELHVVIRRRILLQSGEILYGMLVRKPGLHSAVLSFFISYPPSCFALLSFYKIDSTFQTAWLAAKNFYIFPATCKNWCAAALMGIREGRLNEDQFR